VYKIVKRVIFLHICTCVD